MRKAGAQNEVFQTSLRNRLPSWSFFLAIQLVINARTLNNETSFSSLCAQTLVCCVLLLVVSHITRRLELAEGSQRGSPFLIIFFAGNRGKQGPKWPSKNFHCGFGTQSTVMVVKISTPLTSGTLLSQKLAKKKSYHQGFLHFMARERWLVAAFGAGVMAFSAQNTSKILCVNDLLFVKISVGTVGGPSNIMWPWMGCQISYFRAEDGEIPRQQAFQFHASMNSYRQTVVSWLTE